MALGVSWMLWLSVNTRQWFYADEFDFIAKRSRPPLSQPGKVLDMLLTPHNEHWSTIPILIYRAVFGVVGMRAYWPYLVVLYAFHVVLLALLALLLRRSGVPVLMRCFVIAMFTVYGAGAENLLWAFQFAWIAACIAGLVLVTIVDVPTERFTRGRLVAGWFVGIAGLMCAGIGVSMVVAGVLTAWLRHGWRRALALGAIPGAVQVVWTAAYGQNTAPVDTPWSRIPHESIGYIWRALGNTVERTFGLPGIGSIALVALVAGLVRVLPEIRATHASVIGLGAASIPFLALVAVGRVELENSSASRYSYVLFVFLAPLVAVVLTRLLRGQGAAWSWITIAAGVLAVITSVGTMAQSAEQEGLIERITKRDTVAAFAVAKTNFAAPEAFPDPQSSDLTIAGVRQLLASGVVPNGKIDPQAYAVVLARTSVDVTPEPRVPLDSKAVTVGSLGRMTSTAVESGCLGLFPQGDNPQISVLIRRPSSIKVVPLVPGVLTISVKRDGRSAQATPIPVVENNPVFVNLVDPRSEYVLTLPAEGETKACGITPPSP